MGVASVRHGADADYGAREPAERRLDLGQALSVIADVLGLDEKWKRGVAVKIAIQ